MRPVKGPDTQMHDAYAGGGRVVREAAGIAGQGGSGAKARGFHAHFSTAGSQRETDGTKLTTIKAASRAR